MIEPLRKENAPGTDGRTSELYKALTSCLNKSLADVFNVILEVKWKETKVQGTRGIDITKKETFLNSECKLLSKVVLFLTTHSICKIGVHYQIL